MKKHPNVPGLFIIFLLVSNLIPAKDHQATEVRLTETADRARTQQLTTLAETFRDKEPQKTRVYGEEALQLLNFYPDPKLEMNLNLSLSTACVWLGDYPNAESYALRSRAIAQKMNDKIGEANALYNLGWTQWSQGRYPEAKNRCSQAHEIYKKMEHQKGLARSSQLRGMISWKLGDFSKAIEDILLSINIYESLGDRKGIADAKIMTGNISFEAGEHQKGLDYFSQAHHLYESLGEKTGMARALNNIGLSYCKMNKPSEALKYFRQSLEISRGIGAKNLISIVFSSLGEACILMGEFRHALDYFNQALRLDQTLNDTMGAAYDFIQIGIVKRELKQYREARQALEQALDIAKKINTKNEIKNASKELSAIFEILGDHRRALEYYRQYKAMEEAVFTESSRKKMVEIQALYETDEKEKEFLLLGKDRQLQQLELARQGNIRISVIIGTFLVFLLAFVIYTGYRSRTRTAVALSAEIRQHKQTARKLRESEEKFRTLAEKSVVGIAIIQDNVFKYVNPALLTICSCTLEEMIGRDSLNLVLEEDRPRMKEHLRQYQQQDNPPGSANPGYSANEFRILTGEKKVLHLESYSVRTLYQGKPAILDTIIDITHRKEAETELLKMRKLESVGILAGTIACDFTDLLEVMIHNSHQLKQDIKKRSKLFKMVDNLEKTSLKAKNLAQQLFTFSCGGEAASGQVNLDTVLKNITHTYPQLKKLVRYISLPQDLKPIFGDEEELGRVIGNVLWNAQEAQKDGEEPEVKITAQNTLIPPGNSLSLEPGEYIGVLITDNGK